MPEVLNLATKTWSKGQGIPESLIGTFLYAGEKLENTPEAIRPQINRVILNSLEVLKDDMMNPRGRRQPAAGKRVPMAAEPYGVNITPISQLERAAAAMERRMNRSTQKVKKKTGGGKGFLSRLRRRGITARTRYHMAKNNWVKHWSDRGTGQIVNWRGQTRTERNEARKKKLKKRREQLDMFRKSAIGRALGYGKEQKRGRKPKLSLGYARLFPIRRSRAKGKRTGKLRGRIFVMPGRLRKSAAQGIKWDGTDAFTGGIRVKWGIHKIWRSGSVGRGVVVNYAHTVEHNPNAGKAEGTGRSPYVATMRGYLAEECRAMTIAINKIFGQQTDESMQRTDARLLPGSGLAASRQIVKFSSPYTPSGNLKWWLKV